MLKKVITDNSGETITVKWDGVRFALFSKKKNPESLSCIILNPREMLDLVDFACKLGGE